MYPKVFDGIDVYGIYVHEPGGLLSNLLLVLVCFELLRRSKGPQNAFQKYWRLFILYIGLGAAGGMLSHGFPTYLGEVGFFWVWSIKGAFIPVANVFAVFGVLCSTNMFSTKWKNLFWLKAVVITVAMMWTYSFLPVVVDLLITYIFVLTTASKLKKNRADYTFIFNSFLFALVTGLIFPFKLDVHHLWFTHKDIAHVFAIVSLLIIFRAILQNKSDLERMK